MHTYELFVFYLPVGSYNPVNYIFITDLNECIAPSFKQIMLKVEND